MRKLITIKHGIFRRWLMLGLLLLLSPSLFARYDCQDYDDKENRFSVSYEDCKGLVKIKFLLFWRNCVASSGDSGIDYIDLKYGSTTLCKVTRTGDHSYKISSLLSSSQGIMYVGDANNPTKKLTNGEFDKVVSSDSKNYVYFYLYPSSLSGQNVSLSGKWWYHYAGNHNNTINLMTRSVKFSKTEASEIKLDSYSYDLSNGKIIVTGEKKIDCAIDEGAASCYSLSTSKAGVTPTFEFTSTSSPRKFKFTFPISDESNSCQAKYVNHAKDGYGHEYSSQSNTLVVPAFIYPTDAKAQFNSDTKKVIVSWSGPTISGTAGTNYFDKGYTIYRSKDKKTWEKIGSTSKASERSFTDDSFVDVDVTNESYSYKVVSNFALDLNYTEDKYTTVSNAVIVSTSHYNVYNLSAVVDSVNETTTLRWDVTGALWANSSEFYIVRKEAVSKKSETLALYTTGKELISGQDENGVNYGTYVDDAVAICTEYIYSVYVKAPETYGELGSLSSDTIMISEIGTMKSISSSKGYYPDRTEIDWTANGAFDHFVVERKLFDDADDAYTQIATVSANKAQSRYSYDDQTCVAGNLYSYRVYGVDECGSSSVVSNKMEDYGFRTPTGDFYGRVTYQNGQSVDSVEIYLDSEEGIKAQSLILSSHGIQTDIPQLTSASGLAFQAWMSLDSLSMGSVRLGNYTISFVEDSILVGNGSQTVSFAKEFNGMNSYRHITVNFDTSAHLYIDGKLIASKPLAFIQPTSGSCLIGDGFNGYIDEVRIWNRTLSEAEVANDYTRYIVGNENGLVCYYTFNFVANNLCFDMSQTGISFNGNHGTLGLGTTVSQNIPSQEQLSYKGVTDHSGAYSIRAVPYYGNSTAYTLTPRRGTHQFTPSQEIRVLSASVPSHTVNFTDNSSFDVSGTVVYKGGTYPVEGVQFMIDGVMAVSNTGSYISSDEDGNFLISVPVGVHEVKAVKNGHVFELDGRICNSDSTDRNYQNIITGLELYDITKVKYVGRVCGGTVQESFPVGFSLSKNNLANNMEVVLSSTKPEYVLQTGDKVHSDTVSHPSLSGDVAAGRKCEARTTKVDYNTDNITIHVNEETGEFIAWVFPIAYNVKLSVFGHEDITGDNSTLDLSSYAATQYEVYEYADSVFANGHNDKDGYSRVSYKDSLDYRQKQVFTKRYRATMDVVQLRNGRELDYFGKNMFSTTNLTGETTSVPLYDDSTKSYTFGLPCFITNEVYTFKYSIFEEYPFYVDNKNNIDEDRTDRVFIDDATVVFDNKFALSAELDSVEQTYTFKVNEPDMTTAKATISATFTYGDSDNPTSVAWVNPMGNPNGEGFVFGSHQTGTNFVTAGPDKFLCVLRDPPGSTSYSYLEKGTSFTESSTYTGSVEEEGSEIWNTGFKSQTMTFAGAGVGAITGTGQLVFESNDGVSAGIIQDVEYTGSNSKSTNTTLTTRIQTSDDPIYDGANGDVYVGYSTNISFGSTFNTTVVPKALFDTLGGDDYYDVVYAESDSFVMVKSKGVSTLQNFNTMFAYPQVYIEQTLLPNLEDLRASLLYDLSEVDTSKLQALADTNKVNYYVSLVPKSSELFGQEGQYKVYYTKGCVKCDTINYLNQSISRWEKALSDNDSIKVNASKLQQNYSFQAGANIEYSESFSSTLSSSHSFSIKVGVQISNDFEVTIATVASKFEFEENVSTTQGGEFTDEAEASHSKGFVLAEDGDDDYLSVDVLYESADVDETYVNHVGAGSADTTKLAKKDFYPTFVFRTRGGATSCPYEDAYKASHWKGHEDEVISVATMKLEQPNIDMPQKFIENVPSGEDAYLTVYMKNNSETGEDQWFDLRFVDATNPYGAIPSIDGNSMSGFALEYLVPAGDVLEKTIALTKGSVLNYDNLGIALCSKCQADPTGFLDVISDTVYFSVHFIPSCSDVAISQPSNNWTYNTLCAIDTVDGLAKHYMPITISNFDVNYTDFEHIELQYKSASASDNDWITLAYYYKEDSLAQSMVNNGFNAFTIDANDGGVISYKFFMDDLPDQKYDIRAVSFCNINNELYDNPSPIISGVKDMYNPRLFGTPKPANGVLTIDDDVRIDFNETIAEGMLTRNNFTVTGVRNGAVTSHDVSISLDGTNDYLSTEAERNFAEKDLTFECWVNFSDLQSATFFSHGNPNESIEMGMTQDGKVRVKVGTKEIVSESAPLWEKGSWNHVALTYDATVGKVSAIVNFSSCIDNALVGKYNGSGVVEVGRSVSSESNYFNGKVDQFRIWNAVRSNSTIQVNASKQLSGNDLGLIACYAMDEAKGSATEDRARGANMVLNGCAWSLPDGKSASFDGKSYLSLNSSYAAVTSDMDFTLEFWFNALPGAKNQTLLSSNMRQKNSLEDASTLFVVGFNENGALSFRHNGLEHEVVGDLADNNWHSFVLAVSRTSGNARIYIDGELNTYFSAGEVGGISSDKIYVGARAFHADMASSELTVDQYFTGKLDEIHLWNLYRQQSQIESFYNEKLQGDEMGLLLYYPFEHYIQWQGTAEQQYTLSDLANSLAGSAETVGSVEASSDIPPVKTQDATSSLLYDWVVNNDALIINLKEEDSMIEKTIVTFTVADVKDVNGNPILSPITWSAYVDRNQLKWQDNVVSFVKKAGEEYSFEMPISNNGGSVINYTLSNLPSWLEATPSSGSVNPLASEKIDFVVDPSLAVGSYDETIYLVNSDNVSEPLALNLMVEGDTPDWSFSKGEYSMDVFAQMKMDNLFSHDSNDMLAAFCDGKCVGMAHSSYNEALDMWYAMLTVYSDTLVSHELSFRIWDASKGVVSEAVPSVAVKFVNDNIFGTPTEPVVFSTDAVKYQNIRLDEGWNWVSFPLVNNQMNDLDAYLANGSWDKNSVVKDMGGVANYSALSSRWFNAGLNLTNVNMFKVYSASSQVLSVSGTNMDIANTEISVGKGWNYIGYLPSSSMTVKTALADYEASQGDVIKSVDGFAMYYGNEWVGSLTSMQPNNGYMLKRVADGAVSFTYPTRSSSLRSASMPVLNASKYESNACVVAYVPNLESGDVIRAVTGDEQSEAIPVRMDNDSTLQFMVVSAAKDAPIGFLMERDGVVYRANNVMRFMSDEVYGTPDAPVVLDFSSSAASEPLSLYPNPAVDVVELSGFVGESDEASAVIEIFNALGEKIFMNEVMTYGGMLKTTINVSGWNSGSYLVKVSANEDVRIIKLLKN